MEKMMGKHLIEITFGNNKLNEMNNWLREWQLSQYVQADSHLVYKKSTTGCMHGCISPTITYNEFIYNELRPYSVESLRRCIPFMLDGLKPSQRKVLYYAFNRENFIEEAQVQDFFAYVSYNSAYHHGGRSLDKTIIGMRQDFVGSHNIN